jgi:hypothetical protein
MMNIRRITRTLGTAAAGLLAAAYLPMAVAAADEYVYEPNSFMEEPSSQTGFTPSPIEIPPFFSQETGVGTFNVDDTTTGVNSVGAMEGYELVTNLLGVTETQWDEGGYDSAVQGVLQGDSVITLWQFPLGFANELVDSTSIPGLEDIMITPFGAFDIPL